MYQNFEAQKADLRGQFTVIYACIKKEKKSQAGNQLYYKELEKQE